MAGSGSARAASKHLCIISRMCCGWSTGSVHIVIHSVARPCNISWLSDVTVPKGSLLSQTGAAAGSTCL
eukprot:4579192-Pyramimonas_sp.AAC.1